MVRSKSKQTKNNEELTWHTLFNFGFNILVLFLLLQCYPRVDESVGILVGLTTGESGRTITKK